VRHWLPVAVADGGNLEARAHMLAAASMGATAFQKGLGAIHAISHPVGALYGAHHGETNAVVMPYVLACNLPAIGERLARLARYLDLQGQGQDTVLEWVLALRRDLGIPHSLAELAVPEADVERLVPMALADPSMGGNPVALDAEGMRALLLAAIRGDLR